MRINYFIASWSGPRALSFLDRDGYYLPWHLNQLNQLEKNLSQVTIGRPIFKDEPDDYREYIRSITHLSDGTPVVQVEMENGGHSYGQLSRAYSRIMDFDFHIFVEDDYIPVLNNFDSILLEMLNSMPECGFLCSVYGDDGSRNGAAVSTGIIRNVALADIVSRHGSIPYLGPEGIESQQVFSEAFPENNWQIRDYLKKYSSLFLNKDERKEDKLYVYGNPEGKFLFAPIQLLNPDALRLKREYYESGITAA